MGPLVSVVIPAFRRQGTIRRAVESVLSQDVRELQVIVVDDGSDDDTVSVVRELAGTDPRIELIALPRRGGAQAARNAGIRAARAPWVAFLDSDDEWLPFSLSRRLAAAAAASVGAAHGAALEQQGTGPLEPMGIPPLRGNIYASLLRGPAPAFPALLVKRVILEEIGLLDENIRTFQEWETSICVARMTGLAFVDEPTFIWHRGGADAISGNQWNARHGYLQVVRKHQREMLRVVGPSVLAGHAEQLARLHLEDGNRARALALKVSTFIFSPRIPRAPWRWLFERGRTKR